MYKEKFKTYKTLNWKKIQQDKNKCFSFDMNLLTMFQKQSSLAF